jgi:hypothetical protein
LQIRYNGVNLNDRSCHVMLKYSIDNLIIHININMIRLIEDYLFLIINEYSGEVFVDAETFFGKIRIINN